MGLSEHNVGVSAGDIFIVKKLDTDYFTDE